MAGKAPILIVSALGCLLAPAIIATRPADASAEQEPGEGSRGISADIGTPARPPRQATPFSPEPRELDDQGHAMPLAQDKAEIDRRVQAKATVDKETFRILEPIRIRLRVRNTSDRMMTLDRSHIPHRVFEVHARDSSGKEVAKTRHFLKLSRWSTGTQPHELRPGEGGRYTLVANLVYDLTEPGEYTLTVKIPFYTEEPYGELPLAYRHWMAETKPIKVVVAPFDREIDGK